ncbi:MAG: NADPH-dependent assimilatory sulfite reductase hemoprotein subunit [Verrucomicrobia bacterium]|nr:NADPH-dependent assimilatory sulfite reductase hemoprotein subunit [Verrucomicrobiota bacterium]
MALSPEALKDRDPSLAGTIAQTLQDPAADRFEEEDAVFLKFHGIYQQDDRDVRKTGKHWQFMVRTRQPGGIVPAPQFLAYARLAREYGNGTLRVTSRQAFQFHGVVKSGLARTMRGIHDALATTLAACGDVARNVMAPPIPAETSAAAEVRADAQRLSDALLPVTRAWHDIWVEGVPVKLGEEPKADPLYGRTYLPRKFKTAFAIPPLNDTDLLTNCLGFIAVVENGALVGYDLAVGGGLGRSHGNVATFPRLADVLGFFEREHLVAIGQAVLKIHRDWGDRTNRKHARLKYVLEDRGADWFRAELERLTGLTLQPRRAGEFTAGGDRFGWHRQADGRWYLGLHVEAGRVRGALLEALEQIASELGVEVRLTATQNVLLVDVDEDQRARIEAILAARQAGRDPLPLRRSSMACPALPTCGLALAESERWLPTLLDTLEGLLREQGLDDDEISVRVTGCPNGCARPYMAEIGFVGKSPGRYQLWLGGDRRGTRLNSVYRETIKTEEIPDVLRPVFARYAQERQPGEAFGDWTHRVGLVQPFTPTTPVAAAA